MKLSFKQIKEFTVGAICIEQTESEIRFHRFTDTQINAFCAADPGFLNGIKATTGIRIDFHTDSSLLSVDVASAGKYEILIDSLPYRQFIAQGVDTLTITLREGMKRVTLVLPSHTEGRLRSIRLSQGAQALPHIFRKRFLFFGDSITQGWESKWDSLSYAWQLTTHYDANSYIFGIGGTFVLPNTLEKIPFRPQVIFIAYGTNDLFRHASISDFQAAYHCYVQTLQKFYPETKIVCITPLWRADAHYAPVFTLQQVRQAIEDVSSELDCILVRGEDMIPALSEFFAEADTNYSLHPNDLGFSLYTRNLIRTLTPHI